MQDRKPYVLRKQLVVWNTALALFSIVAFTRVMPLMIKKWSQVGIIGSVCDSLVDNKTLFWLALFTMSKVTEYGDTFFIVARTSPLNFLLMYHHITVSLYTWYVNLVPRNRFMFSRPVVCSDESVCQFSLLLPSDFQSSWRASAEVYMCFHLLSCL